MSIDLSQATQNPTVSQETLAQLMGDPPPLSPSEPGKLDPRLFTLGFTIANIRTLLADSLLETDLLGWFLKFGDKQSDGTITPRTTLGSLTIVELFVRTTTASDVHALDTELIGGTTIRPLVLAQRSVPDLPVRDGDFAVTHPKTQLRYRFLNDANCNLLTHHTPWAEAVFLRRSDLRMLNMYLNTHWRTYNNLLFSGAKVNYDVMHDPPLRNNQFTLPGSSGLVPDSSKAFTLKVEPFRDLSLPFVERQERPDRPAPFPDNQLQAKMATDTTQTYSLADVTVADSSTAANGEPFPAVAIGIPCPDYWEVMEEVVERINPISPAAYAAITTAVGDRLANDGVDGISIGGPVYRPSQNILTYLIGLVIAALNAASSWLSDLRNSTSA